MFLDVGHLDPQDLLSLSRQRLLHILLHTSQEEWLQLLVEAAEACPVCRLVLVFKILPPVEAASKWKLWNEGRLRVSCATTHF